jgi:hypothetical protein
MAGKNPAEAVHNFQEPLQRALACVTNGVLSDGGGHHASPAKHPEYTYALMLYNSPAVLGRDKQFALDLAQQYRVVRGEGRRGPWKVSTIAYNYTLLIAKSGQEVLAYHWHPTGHSNVTYPRLHLYQGAGALQHNLLKAHLPTARIAIEDVVRCVITQLGVIPLRNDWEAILAETQEAFQEWRTWGGSHPPL